ncbi:histone deacetylase 8-like [Condylostylus longicornis]|uniref:histone deacetylase 8-like n=1 Tax=Condylostylus longicornis TaxID=2530218 RepID=UPI00244E12F4|nr:histone deacetylase 8-like [Condylostylus longicornis]
MENLSELNEKTSNNIGYIFSEKLLDISSKNPIIKGRSKIVHSLIKSYNLLENIDIVKSKPSSYAELRKFHSEDYCNVLKEFPSENNRDNYSDENTENESEAEITAEDCLSEYGLGFDCPIWFGLYDYCKEIAGSTISACEEIVNGRKIVINWFGGWHHAQRSQAAGYCYVNDVVLGILKLREYFNKILYIDFDIHHGDAVANAFESTKKVVCLSFHQYEPGFYPGSGNVEEIGFGTAKGYTINFPYKSGLQGDLFTEYSVKLIRNVVEKFKPNVIVVQCGADSITGDPLGNSNLKPKDITDCIKCILNEKLPTLFLGGGGYHFANTSRYWTYLTSLIKNVDLPEDIPGEDEYFLKYSPGYELSIQPRNIKDLNTRKYFDEIMSKIKEQLNLIE